MDGGTVDFYIPNTTTRKDTWQDQALTILNTNPVVLDAAGRAVIWGSGSYRQVLKDKHNNLVWDQVVSDPTAQFISLASTSGASMVGADDGASGSIFTTVAGFISKILSSVGSSIVGFIQSGTGAVFWNAQDKMRERVSAFDFMTTAQRNDVKSGAATIDVTAAIQAAINSLQTTGGEVYFPPGVYLIGSQLQIGNGSNVAVSTYKPVVLRGAGAGTAPGPGNPSPVKFKSSFAGPAILIQGSIAGWGIENMFIEANTTNASAGGVRIESGQFGRVKNLTISGFYGTSLVTTANAMTLSNNNSFENVMVWLPPGAAAAVGVLITGNGATGGSNGTAFDSYHNLTITINNVGQTGLVLQYCDNIQFFTTQIINAANGTGIQFNYSSTGTNGNTFPCDNHFYGLDVYGNSIVNFTPSGIGAIATPNRMYAFSLTNGAAVPHLPNLSVLNEAGTSKAMIYLNGAQNIGNASTKVLFDAKSFDDDNIADVTVNHRITPIRKGYYLVDCQIAYNSFAGASLGLCTLTKNGTTQITQSYISNNGVSASSQTSAPVFCNGTTDYLEVFGQSTGGNVSVVAGSQNTMVSIVGPF